jgi:hypothetical protein
MSRLDLTPAQRLLLHAVTRPVEEALPAWERWRALVTVDALEPDSQWLLPRLYVRLRAAGAPERELGRYAAVYRHNWYKNTLRLRALGPVLAALRAAGSEPVVLGGAAVAAGYALALGARPFDTVTLAAVGLTAAQRAAAAEAYDVRVGRGVRWANAALEGAPAVKAAGVMLCVPEPVDLLAHTLAGATVADDASALLWAADAVDLAAWLDAAGWARMWQRAAERGVTEAVTARLDWQAEAGVPLAERAAA